MFNEVFSKPPHLDQLFINSTNVFPCPFQDLSLCIVTFLALPLRLGYLHVTDCQVLVLYDASAHPDVDFKTMRTSIVASVCASMSSASKKEDSSPRGFGMLKESRLQFTPISQLMTLLVTSSNKGILLVARSRLKLTEADCRKMVALCDGLSRP